MSDYTISIPDDLYAKAQRVAQLTSRRVDEVIRATLAGALDEPLADLPQDEKDELKAMAYLSDDTLWTIARERLPQAIQERMSALMTRNTHGTITETEYAELTDLVARGNRLTLRKAQAMKYLTERNHKVTLDALKLNDA